MERGAQHIGRRVKVDASPPALDKRVQQKAVGGAACVRVGAGIRAISVGIVQGSRGVEVGFGRAEFDAGVGGQSLVAIERGFIAGGYRHAIDDPALDPYWETVRSLGIPIFWEILGTPMPTPGNYLRELDRLDRWLQRYPDVPCVLTHGFSPDLLDGAIPDPVQRLLRHQNLLIELLYPIHWGRLHDYPWPDLRPAIERQIMLAGTSRLVWGSDMPNVERNCTYRQSLEYLPKMLGGVIRASELDAMLGGNLIRLFALS